MGPVFARLSRRSALLIVGLWLVAAGIGNLAMPQLERVVESHARSFMPADAASSIAAARAAELLGEKASNNFVFVVLERDRPLSEPDRQFYDKLISSMRSDPQHVYAVTDLWSQPATAIGALSADGKAVSVMVRLAGMLGTAQAGGSITAMRQVVGDLSPPPGLNVYVSGPGATIVDEFTAIDRQMLGITAATIGFILVLLLLVYRSPVAAAIPLLSVGLALGVARPVAAALGQSGLVEVSLFSVALMAAMTLGAGTDYAIFLIGRYHEGRRNGVAPQQALAQAYRGVAPVIVGSALTVAIALACLSFAQVGMFRSAGIPCAIGVLATMVASLTLTPVLMTIAIGRGYLEPRPSSMMRRWRRIGTAVARWPGPILAAAGGLTLVLAIPLSGLRIGWNEPAATPASAESSRGYAAMNHHFPANQLLPTVLTIQTDHNLRTPSGLIAIERITRQVMAVPGVRMVQSASRPAGRVPDEATLSYQTGVVGRQFGDAVDSLTQRLGRLDGLDRTLTQLQGAVNQLGNGLRGSAAGLTEVSSAADDMRQGMTGLQGNITTVSGYLDPLRNFVAATPDCPVNPICSAAGRVVDPVEGLLHSSAQLGDGATKLTGGSDTAATALSGLPQTVATMSTALTQARSATRELLDVSGTIGPQMHQLTNYLTEVDAQFRASAAGGFYLPQRALSDPRLAPALDRLISADGHATYLLVYGDGEEWGADGAVRSRAVRAAIGEATKEGTLTPTAVEVAGVGAATADLQQLVRRDVVLLVTVTLILIFLIVTVMLRSPVAGLVVVSTVVMSYASALGLGVLVWQHLLGHPLHWAVAPIAFIALIAVGADYNLLLAMRVKEEATAGIKTAIVRTFAGTGGLVTTAGIIFGLTMLALAGSSVLSVAQIGTTIAGGLVIDTLVIRAFVVPALMGLFGRWFWWPNGRLRSI